MTTPLVLDIETIPTESALAEPYPKADRSPPSNWKDEAKIAQWYVDDEAKWRAERVTECSLNPRLGRILCLGYSHGEGEAKWLAASEVEETALLHCFWDRAFEVGGRVVTFNGRRFDLHWLVLRSMALGVEPTVHPAVVRSWFARYVVTPHFDVRALLTNWDDRGSGSLEEWCRFCGVEYQNAHDGSQVYELYRAGRFDEIATKCKNDVAATRALYLKVARMFASEAA